MRMAASRSALVVDGSAKIRSPAGGQDSGPSPGGRGEATFSGPETGGRTVLVVALQVPDTRFDSGPCLTTS